MKLLVVDDQHSVYLYLEKALDLRSLGFDEILYAENGRKAFEMIRSEKPDVLVLDIQMPVMNGIELLEELRKNGISKPETIVLSAYDEFTYAKQCINHQVSGYVLKPIDIDEITESLTKAIQKVSAKKNGEAAGKETAEPPQGSPVIHSDQEAIAAIKNYVDGHYGEDLSLNTMAEKFYISRFQISRLFKQYYHVNFGNYVLSVRMTAAANLLNSSDLRLYEIATNVGFDDPAYFSTVFKKVYGVNPQNYRIQEELNHGE